MKLAYLAQYLRKAVRPVPLLESPVKPADLTKYLYRVNPVDSKAVLRSHEKG